jgi:uncharacterized protein (TIGR02001 family)
MLKRSYPASSVLLAVCLAAVTAASAGTGPGGSVAITSDYVLRGVSQSDGKPAWQGDAHWDFPAGWAAGIWASQVALAPHSDTWELESYLQWNRAVSADLVMGAAAAYYSYPGDPRPTDYNYAEMSVSLMWRDQIRVSASWTPRIALFSYSDGLAENRQAWTLEADWHRDLPARLVVGAGLGFYYPPGLEYASYAYGDASLGWKYGHWRVNVAWIWAQDVTHRQYTSGPVGGPLTATLTWVF